MVRVNVGLKSVSNNNRNLLTLRLHTVIEFGTAVYRFARQSRAKLPLITSPKLQYMLSIGMEIKKNLKSNDLGRSLFTHSVVASRALLVYSTTFLF